jgi:thiopeptide-type bacteriocin biosynthesis protein
MGRVPAAHLTTPSAARVADAVRAVLAGHDVAAEAARAGMERSDLADAAIAYHQAGLVALEQRSGSRWHQVRVRLAVLDQAERVLAAVVGPRLDDLVADGAAAGWWFMRKSPGWRIRLLDADVVAVGRALDDLAEARVLAEWNAAVYEPEEAAFGGLAGMDAAHALFCADTSGVLGYLRRADPAPGRREISLLLISAMFGGAGLDWFERGDVFARIAAIRPAAAISATAHARLAAQLRRILSAHVGGQSPLFAPGGPAGFAAGWRVAFEDAGQAYAAAASAGTLARGLRAVLAHTVIFHWNRLGLLAAVQAALARAAASACLSGD